MLPRDLIKRLGTFEIDHFDCEGNFVTTHPGQTLTSSSVAGARGVNATPFRGDGRPLRRGASAGGRPGACTMRAPAASSIRAQRPYSGALEPRAREGSRAAGKRGAGRQPSSRKARSASHGDAGHNLAPAPRAAGAARTRPDTPGMRGACAGDPACLWCPDGVPEVGRGAGLWALARPAGRQRARGLCWRAFCCGTLGCARALTGVVCVAGQGGFSQRRR